MLQKSETPSKLQSIIKSKRKYIGIIYDDPIKESFIYNVNQIKAFNNFKGIKSPKFEGVKTSLSNIPDSKSAFMQKIPQITQCFKKSDSQVSFKSRYATPTNNRISSIQHKSGEKTGIFIL